MQTIVIDDNTAYAESLTTDIGSDSVSLLSGKDFRMLADVVDELVNKIDEMQEEEKETPPQVLVNRELKIDSHSRQETLGENLYKRVTWRYPKVPFFLYSFRQPSERVEPLTIPLPLTREDIPDRLVQDQKGSLVFSRPWQVALADLRRDEMLEAKEQACLAYMDDEFDKVQHDIGEVDATDEVDATTVNLVRLIYGAVLSRKITREKQIEDLFEALISLASAEHDDRIQSFLEGAQKLMELLRQRMGNRPLGAESSKTSYRRIVIIDDEAIVDDGLSAPSSPWAMVLNTLFAGDGYEFDFQLPSKAEEHLANLRGADLVLLDINFSQDPSYSGPARYGGLDLLEQLQTLAPDLPVIMMSSYDDIGLYEASMEAGAHNYLTKQWSSYTKHGAEVSEEQWFRMWDRTISTPLQYRPFFKDIWMLRSRNLAMPALDNLHEAFREIQSPDLSSARALASFLENFARSYVDKKSDSRGRRKLREQLKHPDLDDPSETIKVNTILRKMRNSIVHYERHVDQKLDFWLFLVLLRVLILRGLTPPDSRQGVPNCSWMRPFAEGFDKALHERSTCVDENFFEAMEPVEQRSYYQGLLEEREQLLQDLHISTKLHSERFERNIQVFVRLVAGLIQPDPSPEVRFGEDIKVDKKIYLRL